MPYGIPDCLQAWSSYRPADLPSSVLPSYRPTALQLIPLHLIDRDRGGAGRSNCCRCAEFASAGKPVDSFVSPLPGGRGRTPDEADVIRCCRNGASLAHCGGHLASVVRAVEKDMKQYILHG